MSPAAAQTILPPPRSRATLRSRLQQATRIPHQKLERHFALDRRWTRQDYRALLEKLWGMTLPLEESLTRIDWQGSGIVMQDRRKRAWLEADLADMGMTASAITALETCHDMPLPENLASGLGALYVLEGATLGGQVILRALQPQLGISSHAGGRFFASYGKAVGAMWRGYLAALERIGEAPAVADAIEGAALQTFCACERWFARPGRAAAAADKHLHV
jgi:heme oxygenase